MTYDEMIEQLKDLQQDKEKYMDKDDPDDVVRKDAECLKSAIYILEKDNYNLQKCILQEKIIKLYSEKDELYEKLIKENKTDIIAIIKTKLKNSKEIEKDFSFIDNKSPMRDANKLFIEMLECLLKDLEG